MLELKVGDARRRGEIGTTEILGYVDRLKTGPDLFVLARRHALDADRGQRRVREQHLQSTSGSPSIVELVPVSTGTHEVRERSCLPGHR